MDMNKPEGSEDKSEQEIQDYLNGVKDALRKCSRDPNSLGDNRFHRAQLPTIPNPANGGGTNFGAFVHKVYGRTVDDEIILRQLFSHDLLPPMRGTGEEDYLSRHRLN